MRRREFIGLFGGTAFAWSLAAHAQQPDRPRRIGVLVSLGKEDPETKARLAAFAQGLQELGWTDGRNIRIDYRWGGGDAERTRKYAAELVALEPDIILAGNTSTVRPLQQATRRVPIVFAGVVDPVAAGLSIACRGRAAIRPDLPSSNTAWAANGRSCSKKLRLA